MFVGGLFRTCITTDGKNRRLAMHIGRAVHDHKDKEPSAVELTTVGFVNLSTFADDPYYTVRLAVALPLKLQMTYWSECHLCVCVCVCVYQNNHLH